jgi:UDP-3-O-[3-hydroxymyristoyl] glucosamine N-acyltransferase
MKIFKNPLSLDAINSIIRGELVKKQDILLKSITDPIEADNNSIIFIDNDKFLPLAVDSKAGLIVASNKFKEAFSNKQANIIYTDNAYQAILILLHYWLEMEKGSFVSEIHPTAIIGKGTVLPEKVKIGAYVVIGADVNIGEYSQIDSFSFIGDNTIIGKHSHLFPNVTVYNDTVIGDNVYIHSGCVLGADGFGYLLFNNIQQKIPQIGQVIIHNHVEIGANTTIDCGTFGPTVIGEGTKIDNLVQIGHNCSIGKHSILCAQVGLAGSTVIGDYVYMAGQVGTAGHLTIANGVLVGAQSGVANSLESGKKYLGTPAREAMHMKKIMAAEGSLPDIYKLFSRIKKERETE